MKKYLHLAFIFLLLLVLSCDNGIKSIKITEPIRTAFAYGEKIELQCEVLPSSRPNEIFYWVSSNEEIATVDEKGVVAFKDKVGSVVISVMTGKDFKFKDSIELTCQIPTLSLSLKDEEEIYTYEDIVYLDAKVAPLLDYKCTYVSKNEDIATVDENGVVTFNHEKHVGDVTIEAHLIGYDGVSDEITLTCKAPEVSIIEPEQQDFTFENQIQLEVQTQRMRRGKVIFTSSNPNIATVDDNGLVTFLYEGGEVEITASFDYEYYSGIESNKIIFNCILPTVTISDPGDSNWTFFNQINLIASTQPYSTSTILWAVDNEQIATIDTESGILLFNSTGETGNVTVTAYIENNTSCKAEIVLSCIEPSITIYKEIASDYYHYDIVNLTATVNPISAGEVSWSIVQGDDIATINETTGSVTIGEKDGNIKVNASLAAYSKNDEITIKSNSPCFVLLKSDGAFSLSTGSLLWQSEEDGEMLYSTDNREYSVWEGETIDAQKYDDESYRLYIKGLNNAQIGGNDADYAWKINADRVSLYGNIMSLINWQTLPLSIPSNCCFSHLFANNNVVYVSPSFLPATGLTEDCYNNLFAKCRHLENTPQLPANELAKSCYNSMFLDCIMLEEAPSLPATSMVVSCYQNMFRGCTSLITPPELNASSLAEECYSHMFVDCISLENPPLLNAILLKDSCYYAMFQGDVSLKSMPNLPATALASHCYTSMFQGCVKLFVSETQSDEYKNSFTLGSARDGVLSPLADMFKDTSGTFTGSPEANMTYWTSNSILISEI